ncbi:MAG: fibronectin type III domain-containing protein [Bacteroidota bacterium]
MKKLFGQIIAILLGAAFISLQGHVEAQTYRILPLGNSITEGYDASGPTESERIAYRKELSDQLAGGGYNFDFVGHRNSGYDLLSDADHGGIPGTRAQYVVRLLQEGYDERNSIQITPNGEPYLDVYPADIILLHIGTNDITHGEGTGAGDVQYILNEIDAWEASSGTHVTVFVARIISRTDDPLKSTATTEFNDNVESMVAGRGDPHVIMVNMETGAGINYTTEMKADGIHPTQTAYDKMGQKWYTDLNAYLSSIPKAPTGLTLSGETVNSVDLSWIDNSNNETGFQIERSPTSSGGDFVLIHTTAAGVTSYTDSGLDIDTRYYYRVRAINASGPSLYSSIENTYTLLNQLAAPSELSASAINEHSTHLTWMDNSESETGFRIERSGNSGTGFSEIHITSPDATSYTDDALTDGTEYFYRIRATDGDNNSGYSNETSATTTLAAPTELSAIFSEENAIQLHWKDNSESETGYKIERSLSPGSDYVEIQITAANTTTYMDYEVDDGISYFYRVCAVSNMGDSDYSNVATTILELNAPTTLTAGAISESSILLTWKDNSESENGFRIERSFTSGAGFAVIGLASADAIFFMDNSVVEGTEYFYRVCATIESIQSDYSNETSAITALFAPTGLNASVISDSSIQLAWNDNSYRETGYRIERSLNADTGYVDIGTTLSDGTFYNDQGLTDGREYFYRICAFNSLCNSDYSDPAAAITELAAPTALSANALDANSILLSWVDNSESETGYRIERADSPGTAYSEIVFTSTNEVSYTDEGLIENTEYFYRIFASNPMKSSGYSNEVSATTKIADPEEISDSDSLFSFYPNPSNGNIIVTVKKGEEHADTYLRLSDFSGRVLFYSEIDLSDGLLQTVFEIQLPSSVRNGYYSLSLIRGDTSVSEKFVLIR